MLKRGMDEKIFGSLQKLKLCIASNIRIAMQNIRKISYGLEREDLRASLTKFQRQTSKREIAEDMFCSLPILRRWQQRIEMRSYISMRSVLQGVSRREI